MSTRADARSVPSPERAAAPPARARNRRAATRRRRLLVLGVAGVVLLALAYGISRSPLLAVGTVRVRGASHLSTQEILDAAAVHEGDAMVWIDTSRAVAGLEALPYVSAASLEREWPDTVRITVRERRPAAWVDSPAGTSLVDGTGHVVEVVESAPPGMPQLLGAQVVPPPGGTVDVRGAARVAGALTGLAAAGTTSVEATDHGVVLHLASGPEVRMGRADRIGVKIRAALAVLDALNGQPVAYVDVSVPSSPVSG